MARRERTSRQSEPRGRRRISAATPLPSLPSPPRISWLAGAIVTAAAAVLYFITAARDLVVGDTPELLTAAITRGVPHAPGYPLFTIIGHLFSLLPIEPLPFRVHLVAVVCGTAAVALTYCTSLRLTGSWAAAAAAAAVLAFSELFWKWSLVAEVFPLSNALAAAILLLLVMWNAAPQRRRFLIAAAFTTGLAMTNHQTTVLLAPAILYLLLSNRSVLIARPSTIAWCVAAILIGFAPYAYVPWASSHHPVLNWGSVSSLKDLVDLFARKSYGTGKLVSSTQYAGGSPQQRVLALDASFGAVGGLLTVAGAIGAFRWRRWFFWFEVIAFAFAGPAFIAYANLDLNAPSGLFVLQRFFLLSHVVTAPLVAFGVLLIASLLSSDLRSRWIVGIAAIAAIAVIAAASSLRHYRTIDQSRNHIARDYAVDIFRSVPPNAIVLAGGDEAVLPMLYLQAVENHRPDVSLIITPLLPGDWYVAQLRRRFPRIAFPFTRVGIGGAESRVLMDANRDRTIAIAGDLLDTSWDGHYWFYQHGLVTIAKPMQEDVKLRVMTAENEALMRAFHVPRPESVHWDTFEASIMARYATPAYRLGSEYETAGRLDEARAYFRRAQVIDPQLDLVVKALARISRK